MFFKQVWYSINIDKTVPQKRHRHYRLRPCQGNRPADRGQPGHHHGHRKALPAQPHVPARDPEKRTESGDRIPADLRGQTELRGCGDPGIPTRPRRGGGRGPGHRPPVHLRPLVPPPPLRPAALFLHAGRSALYAPRRAICRLPAQRPTHESALAVQSVEKPGYASGIRRVWVM